MRPLLEDFARERHEFLLQQINTKAHRLHALYRRGFDLLIEDELVPEGLFTEIETIEGELEKLWLKRRRLFAMLYQRTLPVSLAVEGSRVDSAAYIADYRTLMHVAPVC